MNNCFKTKTLKTKTLHKGLSITTTNNKSVKPLEPRQEERIIIVKQHHLYSFWKINLRLQEGHASVRFSFLESPTCETLSARPEAGLKLVVSLADYRWFMCSSYLCQAQLCVERRSVHVQVKWDRLGLCTAKHKQAWRNEKRSPHVLTNVAANIK